MSSAYRLSEWNRVGSECICSEWTQYFENSPGPRCWWWMMASPTALSKLPLTAVLALLAESQCCRAEFPHCGLGLLSGWEIAASGPWTLSSIAHCLPEIIQLPVFPFFFFNWGIVTLQYCVSFCCTMKWISSMCPYMQLSLIDNFSCARHCSGNFHIFT